MFSNVSIQKYYIEIIKEIITHYTKILRKILKKVFLIGNTAPYSTYRVEKY